MMYIIESNIKLFAAAASPLGARSVEGGGEGAIVMEPNNDSERRGAQDNR